MWGSLAGVVVRPQLPVAVAECVEQPVCEEWDRRMSKVLIIDDEEGFLQITEVILQRAGYQTVRARNGSEGMRLVDECDPDLIILDDMMPGISGSEMCARLKSDPDYRKLPIIMHTAGVKLRNPELVRSIGADALLFKPTVAQTIVETVGRLLQRHPA